MKRFVLAGWMCVGLWLGGAGAAAQDVAPGAFARAGFDARGIAMGNALVADGTGDASPYYNPALAATSTGQSLTASAAFLSMDRELQFLQFATPIQPSAGVALSLIHAGVNGIDGRNTDGYHTQNYSTDEFALSLAFGNRFGDRITAGAALKLYRADLLDTVEPPLTLGVDLGVAYAVSEALQLGLVVGDILAKYEWDTSQAFEGGRRTTDRFPVRVRFGGLYRLLDDRLHLVAEYESRFTPRERRNRVPATAGASAARRFETEQLLLHGSRFRFGTSYRFVDAFTVRAGIDDVGADAFAGMRPSLGFGIRQPLGNLNVRAGYTVVLEPYVYDDLHLVTLQFFL